MIKLYQFPANARTRNFSPYCLKLETWLRLSDIPYESVAEVIPNKGPKGKLPFIEDAGQRIADSGLIIEYLKEKYGDKLDARLGKEQRAQATALIRMLEGDLYFAMMYFRWVDEPGWSLTRRTLFGDLPLPLRLLIPRLAQRSARAQLRGQGMGRHTRDEVYALGQQDLTALSSLLGRKPYFFGDKPTTADAVAYGFLKNLLHDGIGSPLAKHAETLPNLARFVARIDAALWEEKKSRRKRGNA